MKIVVGTKNPAKLRAVEAALTQILKDKEPEIVGVEVESGVADQPMNDSETLKGAHSRALAALEKIPEADIGIGIEGGLQEINGTWFIGNMACAVSKNKSIGYGLSTRVAVPKEVVGEIKKGNNLSVAMHTVTGIADIGKKQGLLGYMTNGHITRESASMQAVIAAVTSVDSDSHSITVSKST